MKTQLTIKNYRCFASPATIELRKGFTAFVGVNNAGKSTAMRFLLEFRPWLQSLADHNKLTRTSQQSEGIGSSLLHVLDQQEVFSNLNTAPIEFGIELFYEPGESGFQYRQQKFLFKLSRDMSFRTEIFLDGSSINNPNIAVNNNLALFQGGKQIGSVENFVETIRSLSKTLYVGPFRNTINVGTKTDYLDIQIGEAFIAQFRALKTGPNKKANTDISRLTEEIRKVFRFDSLDISPAADNSSLHLTVNGRPYKQHEVGSGLSHFIIVLANAALKTPNWILIDEPELNLHPTLQLDFLTTLGKYAHEGVWFSTHSLGLARAAAEQVYSVSREGDGDSKVRPLAGTPRLAEFLGEMSFSSHKELGFEKVLLVEGPTEVKAIQQFLRMLSMDHKILLLPIHGHMPKADELEEILRITTSVAALIDSEKDSAAAPLSKERQDFLDLCKGKGLTSHALERRATENYFPDAVVKKVFGSNYRSLELYEKITDVQPHWGKSQNWKLAAEMTFDQIKKTDLGQFLEGL